MIGWQREKSGYCDACGEQASTDLHYCQPGVEWELCDPCWKLGPLWHIVKEEEEKARIRVYEEKRRNQ